ncbi:MAG: PAS domain S-box protein [Planctomycetota bacterium]|nr:PAS domain S-box protein [Planctomycetota bacterium]
MNTKHLQLLIVEDEEAHVEAIRRAFDAAGAKTDIHAVGTLREYREYVAAHPPDIALLDLNLPDGRAVDVLTQPPEDAPFPVLVMTAFGTQQIVVEVLKAGALDYLVKSPEAFATMPHTVKHVLREWTLLQGRKRADETLRRSEEKYRLLIENSHDILYTLTAEGVFTFVSPAWTVLLGHPTTQVDGQPFHQFVHPDDLAGCMAFLQSVIERGQRQEGVEYRVRHIDGSWRWHTSSAVPSRDEAGTVIGFDGTARDITERRQVEETLRIQHDLSLALGSSDDLHQSLEQILAAALRLEGMDCGGIYLTDPSGAIELVVHRGLTPQFVELATHYPAEAMEARVARKGQPRYGSYQSLKPIPNAAITEEGLRALAAVPVVHQGQTLAMLNLASHTYDDIPVNTRHAIETLAQQIGSILMRLRADARLRESQQNMQILFDTIDDFLFVLDGVGHILRVNAVTSNRLGYATDELVGQDVLLIHPPDRRAEAAAVIADMLAGQRDFCSVPLLAKGSSRAGHSCQERIPGQHEPRDSHAHDGHSRLYRSPPGGKRQPRYARTRGRDQTQRRTAPGTDQRHPRLVKGGSREAADRADPLFARRTGGRGGLAHASRRRREAIGSANRTGRSPARHRTDRPPASASGAD